MVTVHTQLSGLQLSRPSVIRTPDLIMFMKFWGEMVCVNWICQPLLLKRTIASYIRTPQTLGIQITEEAMEAMYYKILEIA